MPVDRGMESNDHSRQYFDNAVLDAEMRAPHETLDAWHVGRLRFQYDAEMRSARAKITIDLLSRSCVVRLPNAISREFVSASAGRSIVEAVTWVRSLRGE